MIKHFLVISTLLILPNLSFAMPDSFADLASAQKPSVVNVSTTQFAKTPQMQLPFGNLPQSPFDDFFRGFLDKMPPQERHALGTGFIISKEGYIVTNNHVVKDADEIVVTNSEGTEFDAELIGTDPKLDLALLKINSKKGLRAVDMGDSDALRIGDWVVAIGNPFGLEQTVTAGIVSAKGRVIGSGPYDDFIQTDAAINPGNSGGPLFNIKGEVVGINTAIFSQSGGSNGIGFAIPINLAKSVFKDLRETGHVQRARLGVHIQDIDEQTKKALGLKSREGALVPQVESGSAADKAGIQAGDVIVAIDGQPIRKAHDLPIKVARHQPGDKVVLGVIRNGKSQKIPVVVEEMPDEGMASARRKQAAMAKHGLVVEPLTADLAQKLRTRAAFGVVVKHVHQGSPAARSGVQIGDVVMRIDGYEIKNIRDFDKYAKALGKGHALRVLLDRHGDQVFAIIVPPRGQ